MSRNRHHELEWHHDQKNAATLLSLGYVRHVAATHRRAARLVQKRRDSARTTLVNLLLVILILAPVIAFATALGRAYAGAL